MATRTRGEDQLTPGPLPTASNQAQSVITRTIRVTMVAKMDSKTIIISLSSITRLSSQSMTQALVMLRHTNLHLIELSNCSIH